MTTYVHAQRCVTVRVAMERDRNRHGLEAMADHYNNAVAGLNYLRAERDRWRTTANDYAAQIVAREGQPC